MPAVKREPTLAAEGEEELLVAAPERKAPLPGEREHLFSLRCLHLQEEGVAAAPEPPAPPGLRSQKPPPLTSLALAAVAVGPVAHREWKCHRAAPFPV